MCKTSYHEGLHQLSCRFRHIDQYPARAGSNHQPAKTGDFAGGFALCRYHYAGRQVCLCLAERRRKRYCRDKAGAHLRHSGAGACHRGRYLRLNRNAGRESILDYDKALAGAGDSATLGTFTAGEFPRQWALSPDGQHLYLTEYSSNILAIFPVPALIKELDLPRRPHAK